MIFAILWVFIAEVLPWLLVLIAIMAIISLFFY